MAVNVLYSTPGGALLILFWSFGLLMVLIFYFFPGLRGSERAHYAGLWSNLRILGHLAMDQLVCFSSCSKIFCCKREFFCFEALDPYSKQPSPDIFIYTGNLTIICFALFTGSTGKLLEVPRIELNWQYVHICIEKG